MLSGTKCSQNIPADKTCHAELAEASQPIKPVMPDLLFCAARPRWVIPDLIRHPGQTLIPYLTRTPGQARSDSKKNKPEGTASPCINFVKKKTFSPYKCNIIVTKKAHKPIVFLSKTFYTIVLKNIIISSNYKGAVISIKNYSVLFDGLKQNIQQSLLFKLQ